MSTPAPNVPPPKAAKLSKPARTASQASTHTGCELCATEGGDVLLRHKKLRVVLVEDAHYLGFCRVVWNAHVREMTDLGRADRELFMDWVFQTEAALRGVLKPDKMNIASLGNQTPHLHWHVIPRFVTDRHFPKPVWAEAQRNVSAISADAREALVATLRAQLGA
jgi:diadenosine tetraphosphate (Ap4A) HIT family hydrolase